jgi:predicted naringenin-chalcone synthase
MSVVAGVFGALPPHRYSQGEVTDQVVEFPGLKEHEEIIRRLHAAATSVSRTRSSSKKRSSSAARRCSARSTRPAWNPRTST